MTEASEYEDVRPGAVRFGTQGWSYADWVGSFYPAGSKPGDYLQFYSRVFDTVELDTTFYAVPRAQMIEGWTRNTPDGFKFAAKFPQAITHEKRLVDASRDASVFLDTIRRLGDRLGPLVVQLPPDFKFESFDDLVAFLPELPQDLDVAVEFRHRSWLRTETFEALADHNVGYCINDLHYLPRTVQLTAGFAYLRWMGDRRKIERYDRVQIDRRQELHEWADILRGVLGQVSRVYGYFNNHYSGHSPATVNHLKQQLGLPTVDPESIGERQERLL